MEVELFILHKTIFLDRDGVINCKAPEHDYIKNWQDFIFLPNVPEAISKLNHAGYIVIIVTNQRGIARGMMSTTDLDDIHKKMCEKLLCYDAKIDAIYVCPHDIGECTCRKPDIGLFLEAEKDFNISKSESWMIGDSDSDIEAGKRFGIKTIKTTNLLDAVNRILEEN